jgi:SAM-dependent methyltransferase/glycosyltransferase involved in cell wall biosynthesis
MDTNTLEIVIAAGGMAFGPDTLKHRSLGGSETAVLGIAGELKKRGHIVTVFCPLPTEGPDAFQSGGIGSDGVRYVQLEAFQQFISCTEVDLLVVSRSPELMGVQHQAKKAVLWCHDLATYHGPAQAIVATAWNFDEIWCVSEWHRQQYHTVTGYPLENIRATRNGIMKYDVQDFGGKIPNQLVYAARPERGLEALVRPGGIMSRLPDYNLKVTMYDNFPPHMAQYYEMLFAWARDLPNVEILPPSTQYQLRQLIHDSAAYVYPTNFEETSCMLARECIEQLTPMITTPKGALPETLAGCGYLLHPDSLEGAEYESDHWCQLYANLVTHVLSSSNLEDEDVLRAMASREDLHWDGVAEQWEGWANPTQVTLFSQVWSLVEDSDIIPAYSLIKEAEEAGLPLSPAVERLRGQIEALYPYLFGRESLASYYERYFIREDTKGARVHRSQVGSPRFEAIADEISRLPEGSKVLDYGCAEGVIILDLAARFPGMVFHGVDHAQTNVDLCRKYAIELGLTNVSFSQAEEPGQIEEYGFDGAICSEVLEHVERPWELISDLERHVNPGGKIVITVPQGPWEALGLYDVNQFEWRAHIWHITKWMLRTMFEHKEGCRMSSLFNGHNPDGRMLGHLVFSYTSDHTPAVPVPPIEKARRGRMRNTVAACVIAKDNEDCILRMLNSLGNQVQQVHIALAAGSRDATYDLVNAWATRRPWIYLNITTVPDIAPGVFGFDDARNVSTSEVDTDWFLWIDTDEYLSGNFQRYMRSNAFDSYAVHQHHFTCDPRGAPTMLDKPARLVRTDRGFNFYGKVHEHAEKGFNGGPGFSYGLSDVDIGHTGYVNEQVRRARFERNFPLLEWDRQVNPERRLGKFLWLRDIIHRMRYCVETQNVQYARLLAEDAVSVYDANWNAWDEAGMGGMNAFNYKSEALAFLGRGLPVQVQIQIGDNQLVIQGIAEDAQTLPQMIEAATKGTFEQRKSGYWS